MQGARHGTLPSAAGASTARAVKDTALYRWMGANSYRTAHYPHSEEMLRLATTPACWHLGDTFGWPYLQRRGRNRLRQAQCTDYVRQLIARDKNHPRLSCGAWPTSPPGRYGGHVRAARDQTRLWNAARRPFARCSTWCVRWTRPVPRRLPPCTAARTSGWRLTDVVCLNRYMAGTYRRATWQGRRHVGGGVGRCAREAGQAMMLTEFGARRWPVPTVHRPLRGPRIPERHHPRLHDVARRAAVRGGNARCGCLRFRHARRASFAPVASTRRGSLRGPPAEDERPHVARAWRKA